PRSVDLRRSPLLRNDPDRRQAAARAAVAPRLRADQRRLVEGGRHARTRLAPPGLANEAAASMTVSLRLGDRAADDATEWRRRPRRRPAADTYSSTTRGRSSEAPGSTNCRDCRPA